MIEMTDLAGFFWLLLLILVANGTPLLVSRIFSDSCSWPVDGGRVLKDGHPLFGQSKTWRGILSSIFVTSLFGAVGPLGFQIGLTVAIFSMAGDLLSSFVKRRFAIRPSGMFTGLDQIPESMLPALAVHYALGLSWLEIVMVVAVFFILNRGLSIAMFKLHLRNEPY